MVCLALGVGNKPKRESIKRRELEEYGKIREDILPRTSVNQAVSLFALLFEIIMW